MNQRVKFLKERISEIHLLAMRENRQLLERERRLIKRIEQEIIECTDERND